jgi:hypothetical protein
VSKNIEDYESCPHSFSFSRPSHHSGKCPWCKRNVLPIIPPPPTPQQPTEASPSAEAMEAASRILCMPNPPSGVQRQQIIRAAVIFDAHFAREFARRVEEAKSLVKPKSMCWSLYLTNEDRSRAAGFNDGVLEFLRALGGEGGKR